MNTIIVRQAENKPVVFLLDTLDMEHGTIQAWHPDTDETPVESTLSEYKSTRAVAEIDEKQVADQYVKRFGMASIRRKLYKHTPALVQMSDKTDKEKDIVKDNGHITQGHVITPKTEYTQEEFIEKIISAFSTALREGFK